MLLTTWDGSLGPAQPLPQEQPAGRSGVGGGAQPGGSHHPWGCRTGTRALLGRAAPACRGYWQKESAGDFTEETITQTKQNQNFIVPSKGLMPGNEWSPCPLPLGDKQNSAG